MFGHEKRDLIQGNELPVWDDSMQQRLLFELLDSGKTNVAGFGCAGLAALEQKAAELHRTATDGIDYGTLIADVEQTNWDAAATLAWLHHQSEETTTLLPHCEAHAVVPGRDGGASAAYWRLESGDFVRCEAYDSAELRRRIADGLEITGRLIRATEAIPRAALDLAAADADYTWTITGKSSREASASVAGS